MCRAIFLCAIVGIASLMDGSTARADSYYKINLRAYRRMMHQAYPGPFGERFLNFVDTRLLQKDGPADQVLNTVFKKLLDELAAADADNMSVARNEPKADPDLTATEQRTVAILNKLGVPIPQKVLAPVPTVSNGNSDGFGDPVTVPPEFTFPE